MNIYKLCDEFYKSAINLSKRVAGKTIVYSDDAGYIYINLVNENREIKATISLIRSSIPDLGREVKVHEIITLGSENAVDALLIIAAAWKICNTPLIPDTGSVSSTATRIITSYFNKYKNNPKLVKVRFNDPLKSVYYSNDEYTNNLSGVIIMEHPDIQDNKIMSDRFFRNQYSNKNNEKTKDNLIVNYQNDLSMKDIRDSARLGDSEAILMLSMDDYEDMDILLNLALKGNDIAIGRLDANNYQCRPTIINLAVRGNATAINKLDPDFSDMASVMLKLYKQKNKDMLEYFARNPNALTRIKFKLESIASLNRLLTKYSKS